MPRVAIARHTLDELSGPYIIAEIGVNHEGSVQRAKRLIELAHEGGAHAAKFQSYKAETLASKHSPAYWDATVEPSRTQYELFKKFDVFGPDEYRAFARHCESVGIDFMSTPFDAEAVEFLAPLVKCFKIASGDLTSLPLLRQVGRHGKPVLLSTGASTLGEIDIALDTLRSAGSGDVVLLHCIMNYPTEAERAHLRMIGGLVRAYPERVIGYSDHTVATGDMLPLIVAYLLGARVLEKHFTHDKSLPGNDHGHAMDPEDLKRLVTQIDRVRRLLGPVLHKAPTLTEEVSRLNARRSVVLARDVEAGTPLTEEMLTYKRPGTGISPLHWDELLGRQIVRDLGADHLLRWEDLVPRHSPPG